MNKISKRVAATAAGTIATSALTAAVSAPPANAAGWLGTCHVWSSYSMPGHAGGWCDGNGPDWTYRGLVRCNNGYAYVGISRWAGDRRGSAATCPSGITASRGGVRVYYKGAWQFDATVST